MSTTDRGYHFGPEEKTALRELHRRGIQSFRYDGPPAGHGEEIPCPCTLTRADCPQDGRTVSGWCDAGQRCIAGGDHLDAWYLSERLFAIAHYPYEMEAHELSRALFACAELGLTLTIDGHSLHNPRSTFAVVIRNDHTPSTEV